MSEKTEKPGISDAESLELERLVGSKFLVKTKEDIAQHLSTASPYDEVELGKTPNGDLIIQRADGMIVVRGPNGDKAPSYTVAGATGDYNGDGIRDSLQLADFTPVLPIDIDGYKIDNTHGFGYKLDKDHHGGKVLHVRRYGHKGGHGGDHGDDHHEHHGPHIIDPNKHLDPKSDDGQLIAHVKDAAKENAELRDALKSGCKVVVEEDVPGPPEIKAAPAVKAPAPKGPKPPSPLN